MARRKKEVEPPVGPISAASCEGVELELHPGHVRGEDPWGVGSREPLPGGPKELATKIVHATLDKWAKEDAGTWVPEVREVESARRLVTIEPEDEHWMDGSFDYAAFEGAIVRVRPPDAWLDAHVETVREEFAKHAAVVRVLPRRRARVLTVPRERREHASARAVVLQLVEESNVEDREALAAFVEGVMGRHL
jgi:hypothetical protein